MSDEERELSKITLMQAAWFFAEQAREFSSLVPSSVGGVDALLAYANHIESAAEKFYPKGITQ